jgi:hypothetical protein
MLMKRGGYLIPGLNDLREISVVTIFLKRGGPTN